MTNKRNPYGDGRAAERIVKFFLDLKDNNLGVFMIPKIIHYCWFGRDQYAETGIKMH